MCVRSYPCRLVFVHGLDHDRSPDVALVQADLGADSEAWRLFVSNYRDFDYEDFGFKTPDAPGVYAVIGTLTYDDDDLVDNNTKLIELVPLDELISFIDASAGYRIQGLVSLIALKDRKP